MGAYPVVIEIPRGSRNKYEVDHETGRVFLDRALFTSFAYPTDYGFFRDTLAHPDLIKNEAPTEWHFERILPYIERALDRIAKTGVAMELNTSGVNKALPEMNPGDRILAQIEQDAAAPSNPAPGMTADRLERFVNRAE